MKELRHRVTEISRIPGIHGAKPTPHGPAGQRPHGNVGADLRLGLQEPADTGDEVHRRGVVGDVWGALAGGKYDLLDLDPRAGSDRELALRMSV